MNTGKAQPFRATGSGAMAESLTPTGPIQLVSVRLHLDAAGGAAENFTVSIDSATDAVYDAILYYQDMNIAADVLWVPPQPIPIANNDVLDFDYANTNSRTYGLEVIYRREL